MILPRGQEAMTALSIAAGVCDLKYSKEYLPDDREDSGWCYAIDKMHLKYLQGNVVTPQERLIALLYECCNSTIGIHTLPTVRYSEHWGDGPCLIRSRLV